MVYHLQDSDSIESNLFSISTLNGQGVIRLVGSLDYEKTSLHQLKILAVDRATVEKVCVYITVFGFPTTKNLILKFKINNCYFIITICLLNITNKSIFLMK